MHKDSSFYPHEPQKRKTVSYRGEIEAEVSVRGASVLSEKAAAVAPACLLKNMYWGRGSMQGHSDQQGDIRTKGAYNYVQERVWESEAEAAASLLHSLVSLKKCR